MAEVQYCAIGVRKKIISFHLFLPNFPFTGEFVLYISIFFFFAMSEEKIELAEPINRLIGLIGGLVDENDHALLRYVSVHDMSVVFAQLEHKETVASDLWLQLKGTLLKRAEKIKTTQETHEKRLESLREKEEKCKKELLHQTRELALRHKGAMEQLEKSEKALERNKDDLSEEDYAENRKMLLQQKEEEIHMAAVRTKEVEDKMNGHLNEIQANIQAITEKLEELKGSKHSQPELWEKSKSQISSSCSTASDFLGAGIEQLTVDVVRREGEEVAVNFFTPQCPSCRSKFSTPPREWLCPGCAGKNRSLKVWQPVNDTMRCGVCRVAPIARFSRHHCRKCGRLVCSRCCSARVLLPELGYKLPEKVCDHCYSQIGFRERKLL